MRKLLVGAVFLCGAWVVAQSTLTPLTLPPALSSLGQSANVDWLTNTVSVVGVGVVAAERSEAQAEVLGTQAARADALRLLSVAIAALPLSSSKALGDCPNLSSLNFEAFIAGALPVANSTQVEKMSDGSRVVRTAMQAPLYGQKGLYKLARQVLKGCLEASARVPIAAGGSLYTGLVLDARGKPYSPCMSARILSSNNKVIWNGIIALLDNETLPGPPLEFSRSMELALQKPKAGKIPLTLQVTEVRGNAKCDVVVSDDDLEFMQKNRIDTLLRDTKLVIVF